MLQGRRGGGRGTPMDRDPPRRVDGENVRVGGQGQRRTWTTTDAGAINCIADDMFTQACSCMLAGVIIVVTWWLSCCCCWANDVTTSLSHSHAAVSSPSQSSATLVLHLYDQWRRGRGTGGQLPPPPKFRAVGKLSEKISSCRKKIWSRNANFGAENPHFGDIQGQN